MKQHSPNPLRWTLSIALAVSLFAACSKPAEAPPKVEATAVPAAPAAKPLVSGIDLQFTDDSVRAQDDFYKHINGKWLATTEIPADKGVWGSFSKLDDDAQADLKTLVEGLGDSPSDPDAKKITDLYASFLNEPKLEELGLKPIADEFAQIDAIKDKKEIPALIANLNKLAIGTPYAEQVHQDAKDSTKYVFDLGQSGLGLPDRDYYLKDDPKLKEKRIRYQAHIENMEKLAGDKNAAKDAADVVALETELAKIQWTKVENRDPVKTYNKYLINDLPGLIPSFDWKSYLSAAGVDGKVDYLIISQPTYFTAFGKLLQKTPLAVWKTYFKWHVLQSEAPYLNKAFVDERFAFYGTALRGIPENRPRWKRGIALVDESIGEGLGKLYVEKYFPPENKARMLKLVQNLIAAYRASIETLDWMGPDTKKAAQEKLSKLMLKIGYPDKWRDYSSLKS